MQRRLHLFLISNSLQESIKKIDILQSFFSDHSPIFMSHKISFKKYFWKVNNSLILDDKHFSEMKEHIRFTKSSFDTIFENNPHSRWEFLKYGILKFTIRYSKTKARERREKIKTLEENLRTLEQGLKNDENTLNHNIKKEDLSMIYDEVGNGIKVRSSCKYVTKYVTKYYIKRYRTY